MRKAFLALIAMFIVALGTPPAVAQPDPKDCHTGTEGVTVYWLPDKTNYTCYCARARNVVCIWMKTVDVRNTSSAQVEVEYGADTLLNAAELSTGDDGYLRSTGYGYHFT